LCGWQAVDAAAAAAVDHVLEHRADGGGLILVGDGAGVVLVAEEWNAAVGVGARPGRRKERDV
jgi:hypothetical protein